MDVRCFAKTALRMALTNYINSAAFIRLTGFIWSGEDGRYCAGWDNVQDKGQNGQGAITYENKS
jgi:hypothetical protein